MSSSPDIKEGFLCPMCMKDLGTVVQLQDHFETAHSTEDKAVINQLKGLFGKAKKKLGLLGKVEDVTDSPVGAMPYHEGGGTAAVSAGVEASGIDPILWEPQEFGARRSHTDVFKQVRDARVDRSVVETNKLLIRLDRLVAIDAPSDPSKRKAYEKSVVPWAPDADVNLCITCGRPFSLLRRRHHCRLCGGIMCNRCSQFLSYAFAQKLTNPSFQFNGDEPGFKRSSSNSSLNSIISPEGELHIRTCGLCREALERRYAQMEQRNVKPVIIQLYDKMKQGLDEAETVIPTFTQMADSLSVGETTYTLQQAQSVRNQLLKLYESIDSLSKRIAILGLNAESPPPPRVLLLQRQIRSCASQFLQENMLGLQSLPSPEELSRLQEARRQEIQRQIAAERQAALEREQRKKEELRLAEEKAKLKSMSSPEKSQQTSPSRKAHQDQMSPGWKPTEVGGSRADDDPMVQQMNIIRSYIKQAQQAQKWDEVHMLQQNLRELQSEYWRQQKASPS